MTKHSLFLLIICLICAALGGCIEDGFDASPSAQPSFSVEQLDMGVQFTENPSPTSLVMVYNRHAKQINLSSVRLRSGRHFRINVDGMSGSSFADVAIRPNDSIYVFVECTLPATPSSAPLEMEDYIDIVTNGVTSSLPIKALAQNVVRHRSELITADVTWDSILPHVVFDTLRVAPGATLTLGPGTSLLFHDKASMVVEGSLVSLGSAEAPITLRGDRTGNVVADISYDVMSSQWDGVSFALGSMGNDLNHTHIVNTAAGLRLDSLAQLRMVNCRVSNSASSLISTGGGGSITALGCELSNAASALLNLASGSYVFDRCTLANFYLFKWPDMAIVEFQNPSATSASFINSIIYGRGEPLGDYGKNPADFDIWFRRVIFNVEGSDDERFLNCLWNTDPMLDYSLTDYTFPYTPLTDSPVLNAADPSIDLPDLPSTDLNGHPRDASLGAHSFVGMSDEL